MSIRYAGTRLGSKSIAFNRSASACARSFCARYIFALRPHGWASFGSFSISFCTRSIAGGYCLAAMSRSTSLSVAGRLSEKSRQISRTPGELPTAGRAPAVCFPRGRGVEDLSGTIPSSDGRLLRPGPLFCSAKYDVASRYCAGATCGRCLVNGASKFTAAAGLPFLSKSSASSDVAWSRCGLSSMASFKLLSAFPPLRGGSSRSALLAYCKYATASWYRTSGFL